MLLRGEKEIETRVCQTMLSKGHIHKHVSIYVLSELQVSAPTD